LLAKACWISLYRSGVGVRWVFRQEGTDLRAAVFFFLEVVFLEATLDVDFFFEAGAAAIKQAAPTKRTNKTQTRLTV